MKSIQWPLLFLFGIFPFAGFVIAQQPAQPIHFKDRLIQACIKDSELPPNSSDIQKAARYGAINVQMMGFDSPDDPLAEMMVKMALEQGPEKNPVGYCLAKEREAYLVERSKAVMAPALSPAEPQLSNFDLKAKAEEEARLQVIAQAEAQAKAQRDADNAEAWSGFFKTTSAMLGAGIQIQQQRIDNTNAQIAASNQQQQSAPAYQTYGQPLAGSSGQQSYDPSKVQTRKVHKPELDAGSCVKLVQLANGDPLSSFGSQVFSNQCGQTVEVFWCKIGDECERGAGGMTTVAAGKSWPVTSGQYRYGACLGANSGALVRDASGVHTGRYACTGP